MSEYLKYDSNQYIEKWCEMENMKFMETDEDNGSKIQGFGYTIVIWRDSEPTKLFYQHNKSLGGEGGASDR
jgi:hypothetical protein